MKTFRRMQHSMRANLPDVRDPALVEEWEAKDPLPRFERAAPRPRASSTTTGSRRSGARSERDVELAIETALADEDASADDLLPAVFGAAAELSGARRRRRSGSSASSPRCARRSTSSSRPIRT